MPSSFSINKKKVLLENEKSLAMGGAFYFVCKLLVVKFELEMKAHCVRDKNKSKRMNFSSFLRDPFEQL